MPPLPQLWTTGEDDADVVVGRDIALPTAARRCRFPVRGHSSAATETRSIVHSPERNDISAGCSVAACEDVARDPDPASCRHRTFDGIGRISSCSVALCQTASSRCLCPSLPCISVPVLGWCGLPFDGAGGASRLRTLSRFSAGRTAS
eukprot:scaffold340_cov256-Pinguiococcus_pyrenoidosus.AAC.25